MCTAGDGAEVRFARRAVDAYDLAQAKRYVATHDVGDNVFPWSGDDDTDDDGAGSEAMSLATPSHSEAPSGENIPNYDNGRGYRVLCADGTYSQSGGIQGACSHHGGVR